MTHLIDVADSQMLDKAVLDKADISSLGSGPAQPDNSVINPIKINKDLSKKLRDMKSEIKQMFQKTMQNVLMRVEEVEQHV